MNDELYNKYHNQLFRWCITKANNYSDAEDLLQEINYQLAVAFSRDVLIVDEERFIWKVAYYTWCKKVKEYNKNKNVVSITDEMESILKDESIDILKQVEMTEVKDILLNHISKLDITSKKCIILYYYEGLSIKEIAKTLNIKENLVKYYLYKARNQLRKELENENI
ncbi:MAG: RNA polymerase sigma factor [Firmicutes bacterium]|nr:RNA polymerase sigma factor [Bacillota bacterium]